MLSVCINAKLMLKSAYLLIVLENILIHFKFLQRQKKNYNVR